MKWKKFIDSTYPNMPYYIRKFYTIPGLNYKPQFYLNQIDIDFIKWFNTYANIEENMYTAFSCVWLYYFKNVNNPFERLDCYMLYERYRVLLTLLFNPFTLNIKYHSRKINNNLLMKIKNDLFTKEEFKQYRNQVAYYAITTMPLDYQLNYLTYFIDVANVKFTEEQQHNLKNFLYWYISQLRIENAYKDRIMTLSNSIDIINKLSGTIDSNVQTYLHKFLNILLTKRKFNDIITNIAEKLVRVIDVSESDKKILDKKIAKRVIQKFI